MHARRTSNGRRTCLRRKKKGPSGPATRKRGEAPRQALTNPCQQTASKTASPRWVKFAAALVDETLRRLEPLGIEELDGVGGARDDLLRVVLRLEVRENVVSERARVPTAGTSDADAEPEEIGGTELLCDRAQAVVPGEAAAAARLKSPEVEVSFVVHDKDRVGIDLEEAGRRLHRATRVVHVRLGLQQGDLVAVDAHLGDLAGELATPGASVPACQLVHDELADVVA